MEKSVSLKNFFKTPENVDDLKDSYKRLDLIYYSPAEEFFNILTHSLGIFFGFLMLIVMVLASTSPASLATAVLSSVFITIMYACSTAYHASTNLKVKRILRRVDYASINLTVLACGSGVCLLYKNVSGYAVFGVAVGLSIIIMLVCLIFFGKFRYLAVVSNFVIGILLSAAYVFSYKAMSTLSIGLYIAGLVLILIGASLFGVKTRFCHAVFHLFVLLGPMLCMLSNYFQLT